MTDTDPTDEHDERTAIEEARAALAGLPNALALAAQLSEGALERSGLDLRTFHLVRAAALAASGAPSVAWEVNFELMDGHVTTEDLEGMFAAIVPIIGTARYLATIDSIVDES